MTSFFFLSNDYNNHAPFFWKKHKTKQNETKQKTLFIHSGKYLTRPSSAFNTTATTTPSLLYLSRASFNRMQSLLLTVAEESRKFINIDWPHESWGAITLFFCWNRLTHKWFLFYSSIHFFFVLFFFVLFCSMFTLQKSIFYIAMFMCWRLNGFGVSVGFWR